MPSFAEVSSAARDLAKVVGPDCQPERLFWLADNARRRPEDWGFPRSWSSSPNWTANNLRREISAVLWRLPSHPSKVAPAYRGLPFRMLSTICDGNIAALWWDAPSAKVRHEWLTAIVANRRFGGTEWRAWADNPLAWVVRHCTFLGDFRPREMVTAQWFVAKKGWAGWRRPLPVGYGPDGQMVTVRPVDLVDEIWPEDLPQGSKTNPERVFRAVMARKSAKALRALAAERASFPALPWTVIPGVEHIDTSDRLVREGDRMSHCVGGYAKFIRAGRCYILRLPSSTAEISSEGTVQQHRGWSNSEPPESDKVLLARWLQNRKEIK